MPTTVRETKPAGVTAKRPHRPGIEAAIRSRLQRGGKALVPFLTAGFPDDVGFIDALRIAAAAGSDLIEVGIPFSDPIADGPAIQYASQLCLHRGMTVERALSAIDRAGVSVPIVLMSYVNPILSYGADRLARDAKMCGVHGAIVPDLPLVQFSDTAGLTNGQEISGPTQVASQLNAGELDLVLLAAPTTDPQRLNRIGRATRGFLYAVTLTGVTGARSQVQKGTITFLRHARTATQRPVLAGFGIASAANAERIAAHCDGTIVGSALIEILRQGSRRSAGPRLGRFLSTMRKALNGGKEA